MTAEFFAAMQAESPQGLDQLDALLTGQDSQRWDSFFQDRARPCPFFVESPDESLAQWIGQGRVRPGRALELGCGHGRNAIFLARNGFTVDAVDFSRSAIEWAREGVKKAGVAVSLIHGNVFELDLPSGQYDFVYDAGCFHHIAPHRRAQYVDLVVRTLKPGGWFGLTCFRPEGGSGFSDEEVYVRRSLGGGLGYTQEQLREIWSGGLQVELVRQMEQQAPGSGLFGEDFLWCCWRASHDNRTMNMEPVLARAAAIVAEIHHSHGIKAAVAVSHLHRRFPHWPDPFWKDALTHARWFEEPVVDRPVSTPHKDIAPARARVLLGRSVIPQAYAAIRSWAAASGADGIVDFYLEQATADPGYLGHRLSILLALGEAWPMYQDSPLRDLYLDRLTEFIVACRFTAAQDAPPAFTADWDNACTAALVRPGFFGHNLICLAWVGRNRSRLSQRQLQGSLGWIVDASARTYPDEEDNLTLSPATGLELTESVLDAELQALLLRGRRNIHLLTLADAIAWLWDDLGGKGRPWLVGVARHHAAAPTSPGAQ